ncbi:lipoprotein insertase outer membrane protein LolB [Lysobacter sp. cf310]|uniref:lipoprotein insertase outer membrane protein LolB n=1 Tax=Lysobacter sp. cf310 TaxID=1761790 RepID=UPI0008F1C7D6|nr:lipoprotein insertase outer membrane protein LolB [Lysobacter sp. cf310]SFL34061.1 outer membrane lipoprotein LolB [Lysobacter sp. cf310]
MKARALTVAALAALLSACAGQVVRGPAPPPLAPAAAEAAQAARESELRAQTGWSLSGRIALSNGRNGGSGRIEWRQDGDRYEVALSAPVTRQSWRLSGDAAGARLEGLEGGTRSGPDAAALLREATGWEIPVAALSDWVRGLRAVGQGPASVRYGADGRPARIEQGGWGIDYRWPPGDGAGGPALPSRLDAVRGEAKVKVIVDEWQATAPAPVPTAAVQTPWVPIDNSMAARLRKELAGLNLNDPAADMLANVERGDLGAIGICGYSCDTPGLAHDAPGVRGGRNLAGTSDMIQGAEHMKLMNQASAYALAYNRALSDWLRRHPTGSSAPKGP